MKGALGTPPSGLCITRRLPIVNSTDTLQQCGSLHVAGRGDRISQEVQMCSWANFYRGLANEAKERAAHATNLSVKDKFEEVAKEWSALAVWAELTQK
jgi:hypothetical protein